jgi:hypothetical protein
MEALACVPQCFFSYGRGFETGIRWYVVHPGDSNVWPIEFHDHPVFESSGYRVYDMAALFRVEGLMLGLVDI